MAGEKKARPKRPAKRRATKAKKPAKRRASATKPDWRGLFERLHRAQDLIDPHAFQRGEAEVDDVELLAEVRAAAGTRERIDTSWSFLSMALRRRGAGLWKRSQVAFARDGCGGTLLLELPRGRVLWHRTDPPGEGVLAPDLATWLRGCVEAMEDRARALPPSHPHDLALHEAIDVADLEAARAALDAGARPDACDDIPCSALQRAAEDPRRLEILRLLLDRGASTALPAWSPPLCAAISRGNVPAVVVLLERGADPELREGNYARTPIVLAAQYGNAEIVRMLVERGADVNAVTGVGSGANSARSAGETALFHAASRGDVDMLAYLLEHGADPNLAAEVTGETPLICAIRARTLEAVRRLLDAGADPTWANRRGKRPLDVASDTLTWTRREPVDPDIVALLSQRCPAPEP